MSTAIARNFQIGIDPTPANNFTLYQPATPDGTLRLGNGNTGITSSLLTLTSAGNLGLGVTPSAWGSGWVATQVAGGGAALASRNTNPEVYLTANAHYSGTNWIYKTSSVATQYSQDTGVHKWWVAPSGTAGNAISFTQAMTLDSDGKLSIGTTGTDGNAGYGNITLNGTSGSILDLRFNNTVMGRLWAASDRLQILAQGASSLLTLGTNNTERARFDASANFLIGTTVPDILNINGYVFNSGSSLNIYRASGATQQMIRFGNGGNFVGEIRTSTSLTTYATSSDYRLKENIQPMTGALAKVAALKPCTYKWKIDGSDGEGFIAHELAEVVPQAVVGEKDAEDDEGKPVYQGIDTSFLVATLTAAIQELKAELDTVKTELAALKGTA